jgi:hypothetical protein
MLTEVMLCLLRRTECQEWFGSSAGFVVILKGYRKKKQSLSTAFYIGRHSGKHKSEKNEATHGKDNKTEYLRITFDSFHPGHF